MAQGAQDKTEVSKVQGINSEASLINFPVDSFVRDEENFVLTRKGTHERRLGIDYEPSYVLSAESSQDDFYSIGGINSFIWEDVARIADLNLIVIQEGNLLRFYKHNESIISANDFGLTINLNDFLLPGQSEAGLFEAQFAEGFGTLFLAHRAIHPLVIVFDPASETIIASKVNVKTRDLKGVEDGLAVNQRVSFISSQHRYNLQNQGWPNGRINTFRSERGVYPSNSDIWYHGKYVDVNNGREVWSSAEVVGQSFGSSAAPKGSKFIEPLLREISTSTEEDLGAPLTINNISYTPSSGEAVISVGDVGSIVSGDTVTFSGTSAFIETVNFNYSITAIYGGNSTTSTRTYYEPLDGKTFTVIATTPTSLIIRVSIATNSAISWVSSGGSFGRVRKTNQTLSLGSANTTEGYSAVEFAHGRAWWAGLGVDEYASYVFFSNVLEDPSLAGSCFQEADPTSEHISDLIATDGGYIVIPEAGKILKLMSYDRFVLVFGTRGIWAISGRDAVFTATEYEVTQVSSIKLLGLNTVYNVEGVPMFFAEQGIYAIVGDQVTGQLRAQSASIESIQTEYENIPYESRKNAKAVYDGVEKNLYWFYKSAENLSPYRYDFDAVLVFSGVFRGYTKFKIERPDSTYYPIISSVFPSSLEFTEQLQLDIVVAGEQVEVAGDEVIVFFDVSAPGSPGLVMYTAIPSATGVARVFSRFTDEEFLDWKSFDATGTSFTSYIETGYDTFGDLMREKQVQWLYVFFDKTEDGFDASFNPTKAGGCLVSVKYAWANNNNVNRVWGPEQAYDVREFFVPEDINDGYDTGFPIAYKKLKPRGAGKAVQARFESEPGKTCNLLGWSMHLTGNTRV